MVPDQYCRLHFDAYLMHTPCILQGKCIPCEVITLGYNISVIGGLKR